MLTKCPCQHCRTYIEFEVETADSHMLCPACGNETLLALDKAPKPTPAPKPAPAPVRASAPPKPEARIEDQLQSIGDVFWVVGLIGAVIAGSAGVLCLLPDSNTDEKIGFGLLFSALISLGQGAIIRTLFRAAAEVIILLRRIAAKP